MIYAFILGFTTGFVLAHSSVVKTMSSIKDTILSPVKDTLIPSVKDTLIPLKDTLIPSVKDTIISILRYVYIPRSLSKKAKGIYELTYTYRGHEYKIILPIVNGPQKIYYVTDQYGNDCTSYIMPYLGPNQNFHGMKSVSHIASNMIFYTQDGRQLRYENMVDE